jgi:hypothetical protein
LQSVRLETRAVSQTGNYARVSVTGNHVIVSLTGNYARVRLTGNYAIVSLAGNYASIRTYMHTYKGGELSYNSAGL